MLSQLAMQLMCDLCKTSSLIFSSSVALNSTVTIFFILGVTPAHHSFRQPLKLLNSLPGINSLQRMLEMPPIAGVTSREFLEQCLTLNGRNLRLCVQLSQKLDDISAIYYSTFLF